MLKLTGLTKSKFVFPQDPDGDCKVELILLKPGELADIDAKTKNIVGKKTGDEDQFTTEIEIQGHRKVKLIVEACVTKIEGFLDESDRTMKCTPMNIAKLMREYEWFGPTIVDFHSEMEAKAEEEAEELEKNS